MISIEWLFIWVSVGIALGLILGSRMIKPHRVKHVDGFLDVSQSDTSQIHQLEITTPPDLLTEQKTLVLKIRKIPHNS